MIPLRESGEWVSFAVRVQPGAKRDAIVGVYGEALKVAVRAPAVDGRANQAVQQMLAEALGRKLSEVEIVSGALSRTKVVRVRGSRAQVEALILDRLAERSD